MDNYAGDLGVFVIILLIIAYLTWDRLFPND